MSRTSVHSVQCLMGDQPWRGHVTLRCRIRTEQLGVLAATNGLTLFFTSRSAPASISSFATPSALFRAATISAVLPSCAPNHGGSRGGGEGGSDRRAKGASDHCTAARACVHACMHAALMDTAQPGPPARPPTSRHAGIHMHLPTGRTLSFASRSAFASISSFATP